MKRFSPELKKQVITEAKEVGNVAAVARKHGISIPTVHSWIRKSEKIDAKISAANLARAKVKKLERELAAQRLEVEILKELLKKTNAAWLGD